MSPIRFMDIMPIATSSTSSLNKDLADWQAITGAQEV
jgi:hypothetical protein